MDMSDRERCAGRGSKIRDNRKNVGCGYGDIRQSKRNDKT
jgi:hypothetical protein